MTLNFGREPATALSRISPHQLFAVQYKYTNTDTYAYTNTDIYIHKYTNSNMGVVSTICWVINFVGKSDGLENATKLKKIALNQYVGVDR